MRLKDKVAIVTRGGSGIAPAAALCFAEKGARVVLVDRNEAGAATTLSLVTGAGGQAPASPPTCRARRHGAHRR